jgi:ligand-binding sensor domain-containing protein
MPLFKKNNLIVLYLFVCLQSFGQEFYSKNLTTIDGLPNNSIYSLYKDSRGILWIGTENGIAKSVNSTITNYSISNGLAHNSCWAIVEDQGGNLWFGSHGGGLTLYDGKKFLIINSKNGLINDKIRRLFINEDYLYVATENGISIIDIKTKKVLFSKKIKGKINKFQVMDFFLFHKKVYFSTLSDGVWKVDLSTKKILLQTTFLPGVFSIFQKDEQNILICHGDTRNRSISQYKTNSYLNNKTSKVAFGSTIFWNFIKDKKGRIFSAGYGVNFSTGGLFLIEDNKAINVSNRYGITSSQIWSLYYDKLNDILYVGTIDKGLYTVDLDSKIEYFSPSVFQKFRLETIGFDKLNDNDLILHKKGLYFLRDRKIIKDLNNVFFYQYIRRFNSDANFEKIFPYYNLFKKSKLADVEFRKIQIVKDTIWLSSTIGLFKLDLNGKIIDYYGVDAESFFIDKMIYYQTSYGGSYSIFKRNNFISNNPILKFQNDSYRNVNIGVTSIFKRNNLLYFVSKSKGLLTWNGQFFNFLSDKYKSIDKEIICSKALDSNRLLVSNRIRDVLIIDLSKGNKIIKKIDHSLIIGNTIAFIDFYKNEIIVGTEKGVNLITGNFVKFINSKTALQNNVIISGETVDNQLFVGTLNGFFKIDLDALKSMIIPRPKPVITGIEVNYQIIDKSNYRWGFYQSSEIQLTHNMNNLSIFFDLVGLEGAEDFTYRYKLSQSGNEEWSNWSNLKNINFSFIPAGEYQLQIEIKNLLTGQIEQVDLLNIIVKPPFWETWTFIIISAIILALLLFLFYKRKIETIKKQELSKREVVKRIAETKMEALQSQMNPHFIFNAMNSIQNFVIDNKTDDALWYIGEFSKMMRQTLNFSSRKSVRLEEEIEYLHRYVELENLRRNLKVNYQIIISENIDQSEIEIPPMLIQPFVENVFVHAFDSSIEDPTLTIVIHYQDENLSCKISDNGKGIDLHLVSSSTSKGIRLTEERINLIESNQLKNVVIESISSGGTCVSLIIPLR